ncbi:pyocin activator PrtN family protein [Providencia hangzhouensis]|uniref:pyocin activator PrtN family protein n=1 Tax=Providencia hangzhouensis TaxID=3031799 RepID=UPI0034DD47A0
MNTTFLLMAEYETSQIPLSVVAEKFLNLSASYADRQAALGKLPIPSYKDINNQKSPRLVHVRDLAEWIDRNLIEAKDELNKIQN